MSGYPLLKKPKTEPEETEEEEEDPEEEKNDGEMEEQIRNEQEEALVALIEHRTKEVEHLRQRITYYKSQVFLFLFFFGFDILSSFFLSRMSTLVPFDEVFRVLISFCVFLMILWKVKWMDQGFFQLCL